MNYNTSIVHAPTLHRHQVQLHTWLTSFFAMKLSQSKQALNLVTYPQLPSVASKRPTTHKVSSDCLHGWPPSFAPYSAATRRSRLRPASSASPVHSTASSSRTSNEPSGPRQPSSGQHFAKHIELPNTSLSSSWAIKPTAFST